MSPIGRIFIVLNLILAAGFLAWASFSLATAENWKVRHGDLTTEMEDRVAELDNEISDLVVTRNKLTDDERSRREERDLVNTQLERAKSDLASLNREKEQLLGDLTAIRGTLKDFDDTIRQVTAAKDRATEQMQEMERERNSARSAQQSAETAQRDAEDAQRSAELLVADLQADRERLQDRLSMLETRMTTLAAVYGIDTSGLEQPDINASILDVRMDLAPGLVMLNVGEDQDVRRGYVFDVYNGNTYKGRVRVENVEASMCSATIVGTVDGSSIQRGDRASTHI
ncbi:MAG: hypothetical protein WD226_03160 [Planctomycetota bacterium]